MEPVQKYTDNTSGSLSDRHGQPEHSSISASSAQASKFGSVVTAPAPLAASGSPPAEHAHKSFRHAPDSGFSTSGGESTPLASSVKPSHRRQQRRGAITLTSAVGTLEQQNDKRDADELADAFEGLGRIKRQKMEE